MDVGLALPQFDYSVAGERPLRWATVVRWAQEAERLGFSSVWLADHLFLSLEKYGGSPERYGVYDPIPALAGLARATERVRLGTLVLCAQLRPPAIAGKALATVDVLSGGRLTVGVGAGWYEPEYRAAGVAFEAPPLRLAELAHTVDVLKAMFGGGWNDAPCLPGPVQQPRPPVIVGGKGPRVIGVAARHADGWNTVWRWTPEEYRRRLDDVSRECEAVGRDPASLTRSIGLYALVGEDERDLERRFEGLRAASPPGVFDRVTLAEWREGRLVGTVAQVREQLDGWRQLGVAEVIVCLGAVPFAVTHVDDLALLSNAVL